MWDIFNALCEFVFAFARLTVQGASVYTPLASFLWRPELLFVVVAVVLADLAVPLAILLAGHAILALGFIGYAWGHQELDQYAHILTFFGTSAAATVVCRGLRVATSAVISGGLNDRVPHAAAKGVLTVLAAIFIGYTIWIPFHHGLDAFFAALAFLASAGAALGIAANAVAERRGYGRRGHERRSTPIDPCNTTAYVPAKMSDLDVATYANAHRISTVRAENELRLYNRL